jgi:hypothetical protein
MVQARMQSIASTLRGFEVMLDEAKQNKVVARYRGLDLSLPRSVVRSEVIKAKTALESELAALEIEFSSI